MAFPDGDDRATLLQSSRNVPLETIEANESDPLLSKKCYLADNKFSSSRALLWYKTPSIYWILPAFFIISITFGLEMTPTVKFYTEIACRDYYSSEQNNNGGQELSDDMCNIPEVQAGASQLMLVLNLCSSIPGIFVLGSLGSISDRMGRRTVLLLASVGTLFSHLCLVLVGNFRNHLGIKFLIIGYLVDGFSGGILSILSGGYAYITDCTVPTQKNVVFGWMEGIFTVGFSLGPIIAGWIVEATDGILLVFYIELVILVLFFLFILFILPESIPLEKRLENQRRYQNKLSQQRNSSSFLERLNVLNLFASLSILLPKNSERALHNTERSEEDKIPLNAGKYSVLLFAGISVLLFGVLVSKPQILLLYTSYVFKWSLMEQGYLLSAVGFTRAAVLLVINPIFMRLFKKRNKKDNNDVDVTRRSQTVFDKEEMKKELSLGIWVIRVGLIICTISYIFCGFAVSSAIFVTAYLFGSPGAIMGPTIKSLQTNLVSPLQIGQLLGALSVLEAVTRIIAPVIFNGAYGLLVKTSPHLIWYIPAFMMVVGIILTFAISPEE